MKIQINKKLKIILIYLLVILISICTYPLYREMSSPSYEEQKKSLYNYNITGSINNTVFLKPNDLYEGSSLSEEKFYISELVDSITTNFEYEFTGENDADLSGTYQIIAKVQGFTGAGENLINIWEKEYPITSTKRFSTNDSSYVINEVTKLNLNEYNVFSKEILETTKINCDTTLTLLMDINLTGTTDIGTFEENITPNIVIPLNTPMFEITTNNIEKPGAIEETIQVKLPINKNQIIFYGVIIGICALGLIFLIFFTVAAPEKDPLEKELNKIFKKHGDRLVALSTDVDFADAKYVRTIDDLVRLADEVERPILYKYSDNYKEISNFYVSNGDEVYVFDLVELTPREEDIISEQLTVNSEQ